MESCKHPYLLNSKLMAFYISLKSRLNGMRKPGVINQQASLYTTVAIEPDFHSNTLPKRKPKTNS